MGSRINPDASLWNLYCFTETLGYTFKPPTRKMTTRSHDLNEKRYFSCATCLFLVAAAFFYDFRNLLIYIWGNYLSSVSSLIKLFGHFNLSCLRISSHFKWEFFVNAKNVVVFFVVLCGANETSELSFGGGSSSGILLLV